MNLKTLIPKAKANVSSNSTTILTVFGIVGLVATVILVAKATPKANEALEESRAKREKKPESEQTVMDKVTDIVEDAKAVAPAYGPAIATATATVVCMASADIIGLRKLEAATAAYNISETARKAYAQTTKEIVGEKKEREIHEESIVKATSNVDTKKPVIFGESEKPLICDPWSERYFRATIEDVRAACNELNRLIANEMYASLNDFYDIMEWPSTRCGEHQGWSVDDGLVYIDGASTCVSEDGRPCFVLEFTTYPRPGYDRY